MKELEKTKRISISAVLFLLVIVIGLLTFKRPQYNFNLSATKTLEALNDGNHVVTLDQFKGFDPGGYLLVDVRKKVDYDKGHIENAINIPLSELLTREASEALNSELPKIIYGENPEEANSAWMLLFQLGQLNVNILEVKTFYHDKKFQLEAAEIEKPVCNYAQKMEQAKASKIKESTPSKPVESKKKAVITAPKKKKRAPEGGC